MNIIKDTHYDRIDMHMAKACDMIVSDLREQTVPGQLQEIFQNLLLNLPSNHVSLLKKEDLVRNLFLDALEGHKKLRKQIIRPDTRSWFAKISETITAAKETFAGKHV